jgi:hypothetical protein
MTNMQLIFLGLTLGAAVVAYRRELVSLGKNAVGKLVGKTGLDVKPSIAVTIVAELISVTELRDKLAAEGCEEGVAACTALLRVIVEQSQPTKTAV